jgi:hypothetical protein
MKMNLDKYIDEMQHLLHIMKVEDKSISVSIFDSIGDLVAKQKGFKQFENARNFGSFQKAFGWEMARVSPYIFFVKKVRGKVVYIEVEVA